MNTLRAAFPILALTLALAAPAAGQELESFGVMGGISRATMGGGFIELVEDVGGTVDPRFGFALGGFASFAVATNTSLRGELLFTQKGVHVPPDGGLNRRDIDITYFDLAALARRRFPLEAVTPWVGAGPVLSFRGGVQGRVNDVEFDASDEVKGTDLGFALEVGAGKNNIDVGLRYLLGLSNVSTSPDPDEASKNRAMFLTVSYAFPR